MILSRFNQKLIFILLSIFALSFLLSIFIMQSAAVLIFIFWLFENNYEKKKSFDQITAFILIFGLVRLITIFLSEYPQASYKSFYKEALFYTSAVSLPFYLKTLDKQKVLKLIFIFILGAVVISIIGSIRFFIGDVKRAEAFSSGYTSFSGYLLTAFAVAIFYPKKVKDIKEITIWSLVYAIILTGIFTSLGRANIVIAVLILISAIFLKQIPIKQFAILACIGLVATVIYFYHPSELINERVENITYLSDRDIIWMGAKEIGFEHPIFGFGPRTFHYIFPFKDKFADKEIGSWHNDFLQVYFESGILGLIAFLGLLWIIIKTSINNLKNKKNDSELKFLSRPVLISVIALICSSLTSGFITSPVLSIVFVFLISFLSRIDFEIKLNKKMLVNFSSFLLCFLSFGRII